MLKVTTSLFCIIMSVQKVESHARLLEPPSRASMWRMGFNSPENFDDDQTYCGGWGVQWSENNGRCGVCGDPWNSYPREHEAPFGKFATGTIVRKYRAGDWVPITVDITTNHGGFFIFKLCHNDNINQDPDQHCFDQNILVTGEHGEQEFKVTDDMWGPVKMFVKLPDHVSCHQCILQWTWIAANNWGSCHAGGRGMGCGPQETFRSCADISISDHNPDHRKKATLKKLYKLMLQNEKEKSYLLKYLKALKVKRDLLLQRSSVEDRSNRRIKDDEVDPVLNQPVNQKREQKLEFLVERIKSESGSKKLKSRDEEETVENSQLRGSVIPWWRRIVTKSS